MKAADTNFWDTPLGTALSILIVCIMGGGLGALFAYAMSLKAGGGG